MSNVIIGEMYKQLKKKSIIVLALVALIPFAFSLLITQSLPFWKWMGNSGICHI